MILKEFLEVLTPSAKMDIVFDGDHHLKLEKNYDEKRESSTYSLTYQTKEVTDLKFVCFPDVEELLEREVESVDCSAGLGYYVFLKYRDSGS